MAERPLDHQRHHPDRGTLSTAAPAAPTGRVLALAASAFVVLAAEPLYLLVDTAVVGHLGPRALAGLGVGAALMGLLTIVGTFVEYGTTARAARWFGAGRIDDAVGEGVQASWLAAGIGVVVVARRRGVRRPAHRAAGRRQRPDPARRRVVVPDRGHRDARRAARAGRQRLDARRAAHPRTGGHRARGQRAVRRRVADARVSGRARPPAARRSPTSRAQAVGAALFLVALRRAAVRAAPRPQDHAGPGRRWAAT